MQTVMSDFIRHGAHRRYEVTLPGESAPLMTHLRRFGNAEPDAPAVVLLHGGNTSGDTFLVPEDGLAGFLVERKFDVWILEWRSSPRVVVPLVGDKRHRPQPPLGGSVLSECRLFTLDHVVEDELPTAFDKVREEIGEEAELSVLGHCLGSAAVSMAIARGKLERFGVRNVVLSTLGLFVETPWKGWVKAEDFLLERVLHEDPKCRGIDPHDFDGWPKAMKKAFERWPAAWLPRGTSPAEQFLRRLSFMFGQPYSIHRLHPSLRDGAEQFFGPMHMGLFLHAGQMVRRGFAARFDAPDIIDRSRLVHGSAPGRDFESDLVSTHFQNKRVTVLAAGSNHLWHRESADLMYDWLRSTEDEPRGTRFTKRVFPGYNLQELMWGERARQDVFPVIEECIRPQAGRSPTTGKVAVSVQRFATGGSPHWVEA